MKRDPDFYNHRRNAREYFYTSMHFAKGDNVVLEYLLNEAEACPYLNDYDKSMFGRLAFDLRA